uniref:ADP-L-glycero-D-manno-heptose-6-epimerase n=1 Tax=Candidatus Methanogaster sp. ANME-2c ERB4 TaxID=2759911 RepID=A0A7G9YJ53_9EURY|nr:ADP-L-glycero-D-manno-heptose-6-epimerase [Methanosarcinales archaeon ANME-2c ERB4]
MKTLVTGGAGFIGSNLTSVLVKEYDVTVLDNFHTGSADNLDDVENEITIIDDSSGSIGKQLSNSDIDVIFHLGIPSSSPMYKENPMLVGSAINDAISVFEFAKETGAKVVFASSSSLYNGLPTPNQEDMDVMVADYYTEARLGIERVAELYHKLYGISMVGLRFFSVYGPNERAKGIYANIVSQFLWEIQDGKIPVIYGDGEQTRDFTFVSDVVRACILAMTKDVSGVFNVGTGVSHSFNDVVVAINGVLGTDIEPRYIDNPVKNYVAHTLADLTKVKDALGFSPEYSLEEGIGEIV